MAAKRPSKDRQATRAVALRGSLREHLRVTAHRISISFCPNPPQQSPQRIRLQRHAPRRRRKSRPRHVNEHRAAAAGNARPGVVVDFDNQIIEMVGAAQPVAGLSGRQPEGPIVAPVGRILAPGIVRPDSPDRQPRDRPRSAVGPPPQPHQPKPAARRCAVAFALVGQDAAAAERHRQCQRPGDQPSFGPVARPGPHPQRLQGSRRHARMPRMRRNKVARRPLTKRAARAYDITKCVLRCGNFAYCPAP